MAVSVYDLIPHQSEQLKMFGSRSHAVAEAMDKINDTYAELVITPALMMGMDDTIIDRIAFGGVKELEKLYQQQPLSLMADRIRLAGANYLATLKRF